MTGCLKENKSVSNKLQDYIITSKKYTVLLKLGNCIKTVYKTGIKKFDTHSNYQRTFVTEIHFTTYCFGKKRSQNIGLIQ